MDILTLAVAKNSASSTPGQKGDTGNGIKSTVMNDDYTLTIEFTDGTSYTTPSIRGEKGETGSKGAKGDKGDTGAQGIQGIQGEKGDKGETGDSAYEIAKKNGFVGTEEEWLESLKVDESTVKSIVDKVVEDSVNEISENISQLSDEIDDLSEDITDLENEISSRDIVVSKSGASIVATDSDDKKLKGLKTFGKSTQRTTTGKNLLKNIATSQTVNGITFTVNDDGSVTANGTAEATATLTINKHANKFIQDGKYILNGCPASGSNNTYRIQYYDIVDSSYYAQDTGNGTEINIVNSADSASASSDISIVVFTGTVCNNLTFYPMLRHVNITDGTYEPYTNGASPNPEYPQPIESVGDDGSVEVGVYGGNLFDKNDESMRSHVYLNITATALGFVAGKNNYSVVLKVNPNTDYTIYCQNCTRLRACTTSELLPEIADKTVSTNVTGVQRDGNTSLTINSGSDGNYLYVNLSETEEEFTQALQTLIVSVGTKVLPYELYKPKQSLAITTPNGLPGIPVTDASLATYTDENGQMWCADEIDFERGVFVQRIGKEMLNTFSMGMESADITGRFLRAGALKNRYLTGMSPVISNKFYFSGWESPIDNKWVTCLTGSLIYVTPPKGSGYTLETLNAYLAEKITADNPLIVIGILETHIETPLTEEEIAAYKAVTMNYPTTTILTNNGAGMKVEYIADTQNHIEQNYIPKSEFNALVTRVKALEQNAV